MSVTGSGVPVLVLMAFFFSLSRECGLPKVETVRFRRHPVLLPDDVLLNECTVRRGRHGGPGGQHRNKVETAVELIHRPTGISAAACERRSQKDNLHQAIRRLRICLAIGIRTVESSDVRPSDLWISRCRGQRIICSERHQDFPVLLAESLDAIHAKDYDVKKAAGALGCSTTQLVRFVGRVPEALAAVNDQRQQRGLRTLKA